MVHEDVDQIRKEYSMTTQPSPTQNKPTATVKEPAKAEAATKDATPKEKKPRVQKEGATPRPRLPKYPDEHLITVLKENAKARGANERFKRYATGMSVKAYVDKVSADFGRTSGQTYADMRWDADHGFIHVGPTTVPVPPAQPAAAKPATPPAAAKPATPPAA
jgi:hypothetical protein